MKKNNLTQNQFTEKLIDSFMKLILKADLDKTLFGNSYWEFTDRKIEVINPMSIKINKDGVVVCPKRLTKYKLKGKTKKN